MQNSRAGLTAKLNEYYRIATWAFLALACAYACAMRIYFAGTLPIWLDESWTAVLSSAPSLQSFVHQMWLDSNAPLYYFIEWVWPFESDLGLRIPSLLYLIAAAASVVVWAPLDKKRRWFWAALLVLWPEGISLFQDARYYALLYLLAAVQTIVFARLIERPSLKRAVAWASLSTLAILTHYFAAIPSVIQGLYFFWKYRLKALQMWPALSVTLPAFAWLIYHWPRLRLYGEPGISWYSLLTITPALKFSMFGFGGGIAGGLTLIVATLFWNRKPIPAHLKAPVATAALSVLVTLVIGFIVPMFSPRYLLPMVPPLLFGIASTIRPGGFFPLAAILFVPGSGFAAWSTLLNDRANFGIERAASLVPDNSDISWWIDYPGSKIHDRRQMKAMLEDALGRAHKPFRSADWGTDFRGASIIIYGRTATFQRPGQCRELSGWGHLTVVCAGTKPLLDAGR